MKSPIWTFFLLVNLLSSATSQDTLPESCIPACQNFQGAPITITSAGDCNCITSNLLVCSGCFATLNTPFAQSLGSIYDICSAAQSPPSGSGATPVVGAQPKCPSPGSGPITIPILHAATSSTSSTTTTSSTSRTTTTSSSSSTTTTSSSSSTTTSTTSSSHAETSSTSTSTSTSVVKTLTTSTAAVTTVTTPATISTSVASKVQTTQSPLVTPSRSIAIIIQPWMGSQVVTAIIMVVTAALFVFMV